MRGMFKYEYNIISFSITYFIFPDRKYSKIVLKYNFYAEISGRQEQ